MTQQGKFAATETAFVALEHAAPIVQIVEGVATTTSMRIANGTENEHASVLRLIRDNLDDFEEFGLVGFEIRPRPSGQHGGGDVQIAVLNEEHATLLLTYMRNNAIVKDFKKRLVREFSALRRGITGQSREERLALAVIDAQQMLTEKDQQIAVLAPKAEFYDDLMDADGTYSFLAASKILGWGRNVMMRELRRSGVLQGNNLPYQRYEHHFKVTPGTYTNQKTGELVPTATTTVRPSGLEFLRKKLDRSPVVMS
jgi:phage antirepressor YoqD-like protein